MPDTKLKNKYIQCIDGSGASTGAMYQSANNNLTDPVTQAPRNQVITFLSINTLATNLNDGLVPAVLTN